MMKLCSLLISISLISIMPAYAANNDSMHTAPDFSYKPIQGNDMKFASLDTDFMPVERRLIDDEKKKDEALREKKSSSWWKWALGILIVGAAASVAGGGNGEGGSSSDGTLTVTW